MELAAHADGFQSPMAEQEATEDTLYSELNGNFFKFLRMIEINKYFNLEANSTDSQINYDKFQDDLG